MSDINQILEEVDANYRKHLLFPSEIISEYQVLLSRWTTDELAKMITIGFVIYAVMKYVHTKRVMDEAMRNVTRNITLFVSSRYPGGKAIVDAIYQYLQSFEAYTNQNIGKVILPDNIPSSDAVEISESCGKGTFPIINWLVVSALGEDYPKSTTNFYKYLINSAEKDDESYAKLIDEYYHVLKGDSICGQSICQRPTSQEKSDVHKDAQRPQAKTGCIVPLLLAVTATVLCVLGGCASTICN